jgi:archaellum component FlaG (FlaF/FlaG flagellin family)
MTQAEMTVTQEKIRQTDLNISYTDWTPSTLTLYVLNTGTTSFNRVDTGMELYICDSSNVTHHVTSFTSSIQNDITNKGFWDPTEIMTIEISDPGYTPIWVKYVTPNGVTASANID